MHLILLIVVIGLFLYWLDIFDNKTTGTIRKPISFLQGCKGIVKVGGWIVFGFISFILVSAMLMFLFGVAVNIFSNQNDYQHPEKQSKVEQSTETKQIVKKEIPTSQPDTSVYEILPYQECNPKYDKEQNVYLDYKCHLYVKDPADNTKWAETCVPEQVDGWYLNNKCDLIRTRRKVSNDQLSPPVNTPVDDAPFLGTNYDPESTYTPKQANK